MDYCVCQATGPHELQAVVSARIAEGWEPIGGIAVDHTSPFDTKAHQAMIRRAPAPETTIIIEEQRCWWCRMFTRRFRTVVTEPA
jgi:hypothetical protein